MIKRKVSGLILGCLLVVGVAEARNNAALFGVAAAAVAGAAILANSQPPPPQYHEEPRRRYYKKHKAVVVTPNMKIQKTLTNMGLYQGKIDGKLNTYISRTAIKKLNAQYVLVDGTTLDQRTRDQLLYLSDLYKMDKYLFTEGNKKRVRGRRLQAALGVHGTYFGKIDGIVGNGTRKAIALYKNKEGLSLTTSLSSNEIYDLVGTAREMNTKAIDEAIEDLSPRKQSVPNTGVIQQDRENQNMPRESQSNRSAEYNQEAMQELPEMPVSPPAGRSVPASLPDNAIVQENQQDNVAAPGFE